MPNEVANPRWVFSVTRETADKRQARPSVPPESAFEHVGVDATIDGGLVPHYGFKFVRDLTGTLDEEQEILDGAFPVTFRTGDSEVAVGVVYRTAKITDPKVFRVWLEYRRVATGAVWVGPVDLVGEKSYTGQSMDVKVVGKFVWVFIEGMEPFFFYYDTGVPTTNVRVVDDTGANKPPKVVAEQKNIVANAADDYLLEQGSTLFFLLPVLSGVPANWVTSTKVLAKGGLLDGGDTIRLFVMEWNANGAFWLWPLRGPGDVYITVNGVVPTSAATPTHVEGDKYWLVFDGDTQEYTDNPEPWNRFANVVDPPAVRNKWNSGYAGVQGELTYIFDPNPLVTAPIGVTARECGFIFQFFDTRTGRKSNFSDRVSRAMTSFHVGSYVATDNGDIGVIGSRRASDNVPVVFPMIEVVYDADKWDSLFVYRTVFGGSALALDGLITLADYEVRNQEYDADNDGVSDTPLPAPYKRAAYVFDLTDAQLAASPKLTNVEVSAEEMPTAGAAIFHEGTMFFGNTATLDVEKGTVGLVQWSDPFALSVEQVSPSNLYYLQLPTDEVVRFEYLGPNVVGLSRQGIYLFRKETSFIKGFPLHIGFGVTHERAACAVGSTVYFATEFGLKSVDASGTVRDISVLDHVFLKEWMGLLTKVRMAYDATTSCIFVLLGNFGEATAPMATDGSHRPRMAVLWLNTSRMTEIYDTPFSHVVEGDVWVDPDDPTSDLQRRAVFFQELRQNDGTRKWRMHVTDYRREKGETILLDTGQTQMGWVNRTVYNGSGALSTGGQLELVDRIEGATLYVVTGALTGRSSRILHQDGSALLHLQDPSELAGLAAGDVVSLNPVYFRWVGPQVGLQDAAGQTFAGDDYFRMRRVETVGVSLVDVEGEFVPAGSTTNFARWNGLLYRGTEAEPVDRTYPRGTSNSNIVSLQDGPSDVNAAFGGRATGGAKGIRGACLHVGVEVLTAGVTYRMLGVKVTGSVEAKDREGTAG